MSYDNTHGTLADRRILGFVLAVAMILAVSGAVVANQNRDGGSPVSVTNGFSDANPSGPSPRGPGH